MDVPGAGWDIKKNHVDINLKRVSRVFNEN